MIPTWYWVAYFSAAVWKPVTFHGPSAFFFYDVSSGGDGVRRRRRWRKRRKL
jgi:hypothetical protein